MRPTPQLALALTSALSRTLVLMSKRPGSESEALIKRVRTEENGDNVQSLVVASDGNNSNKNALIQTIRRTSGLQAPIMCLRVSLGHTQLLTIVCWSTVELTLVRLCRLLDRRVIHLKYWTSNSHPMVNQSLHLLRTKLSYYGEPMVIAKSQSLAPRIPFEFDSPGCPLPQLWHAENK